MVSKIENISATENYLLSILDIDGSEIGRYGVVTWQPLASFGLGHSGIYTVG